MIIRVRIFIRMQAEDLLKALLESVHPVIQSHRMDAQRLQTRLVGT